jgi:DNA-binding transcriptional regulator GbsR (MarR family)
VLSDIQAMIRLTFDEADARQKFLAKKATFRAVQSAEDKKREREVESRLTELEKLI